MTIPTPPAPGTPNWGGAQNATDNAQTAAIQAAQAALTAIAGGDPTRDTLPEVNAVIDGVQTLVGTKLDSMADTAVPAGLTPSLAAGVTGVVTTLGANATAPSPSATFDPAKPQRFGISNQSSGAIILTLPNVSGTTVFITLLAGEGRVYRQASTLGYRLEAGIPLAQQDNRYTRPNAKSDTVTQAALEEVLHLENFGGKCDGFSGSNGVAVAGSPNYTDPTATFSSALKGQYFTTRIGDTEWSGFIVDVPNTTTLVIDSNAPVSSTITGTTASMTAGSSNLLLGSAQASNLKGAMVSVTGAGASGATLTGQILTINQTYNGFWIVVPGDQTNAVQAATTVSAASYSINQGKYKVGSVDDDAWDKVLAEARKATALTGRSPVIAFVGISMVRKTVIPDRGIKIEGANQSNAQPTTTMPTQGSIIRAHGGFTGTTVVQLGTGGKSYVETGLGATLEDVTVDADESTAWAVITGGNLNRLVRVTARNGTSGGTKLAGWQTVITEPSFAQPGYGIALQVNEDDAQCFGGFIKSATYGIQVLSAGFLCTGTHLWNSWAPYVSGTTNTLIEIRGGSNHNFTAIELDNCVGHQVTVAPTANTYVKDVMFTGITSFQISVPWSASPNNTYSVFNLTANNSGSNILNFNLVGLTGNSIGSTQQYASIVRFATSASIEGVNVSGVSFRGALAFFSNGALPAASGFVNCKVQDRNLSVWRASTFPLSGANPITASGTGSQTAFTVAHNMGVAPQRVSVTPASAAAAAPFFVTSDATNVTVTYTTAPASGSNNLAWNVRAEL